MKTQDELKKEVGFKAALLVENGMKLGIGTGSTANMFIDALGERVKSGLKIIGVPTSIATEQRALKAGIPLKTLEECPQLDLTIDGTDEFDPFLNLIKGGGGALLREKIVAQASHEMLVICDSSKAVENLGAFPLPVEVNQFGFESTKRKILQALEKNNCETEVFLRKNTNGQDFVTDGGHLIIDCKCKVIHDPERLSHDLFAIAGVVEHGLFLRLAKKALVATLENVQEVTPK